MTELTYEELTLPNYRNSRQVFANLDVSDLAKAAVLAPLNLFLNGDTGTGKTQMAKDFMNHYFGGSKSDGGQGIIIRGYRLIDSSLDQELFQELDIENARRKLTGNIDALLFLGDEINRAPVIRQNDFLEVGDGALSVQGRNIPLGRDGYHLLIATANLGNGEFGGTFSTDKALYNRLHVAIDFDHPQYKPTMEDEMLIDKVRANPNVKEAKFRDISDKIIEASKAIGKITADPGMDALAVVNYLRFGLDSCMKNGQKGKVWPMDCQDCSHNKTGSAVCSLVRAPVRRTTNAMIKYASALYFLAKLKDPKEIIDPVDLMFKSFELTGAYQMLLNPAVLRNDYNELNPKMMKEVVEKLKAHYRENEPYIKHALSDTQEGKKPGKFFKHENKIGRFEDLNEKARTKFGISPIDPFTDNQEIGMKWAEKFVEYQSQNE